MASGNLTVARSKKKLVKKTRPLPLATIHMSVIEDLFRTYSIACSIECLDGGAKEVGCDRKVFDKVVEELPVLTAVELLCLGVPDGSVGRGISHVARGVR